MPDRLTPPGPALPQSEPQVSSAPDPEPAPNHAVGAHPLGTPWRPVALQVAAVLVIFAVASALCGLLWFRIWTPATGTVVDQEWFTDEAGLRNDFSGTGLYVVVALVAGLLLGALTAFFLDRSEVATLVAVVIGSILAAWLMLLVGQQLGPPNPDVLARTATDGAELPADLHVSGLPPRLAFPAGALIGLSVVYLLTRRHGPADEGLGEGTRG